jgi:hypothetical protein
MVQQRQHAILIHSPLANASFGILLLSKQLQQDLHIEISVDELPSLVNNNPCNSECICFISFNNSFGMIPTLFCQ